ncbi:multidrug effflux MFS transporter [Rhodovulum sp. DZ06]|uniref:multidrug effflux MFS transporter n=1 Tax=Rhodovulum sp. DZ06 TaxID=3425126 RepID=UPI003D339951
MSLPPDAPPHPKAKLFDRTTPPHVLTLVLIAGIGPMAMNVFLPSLPGIAAHFEADYALVQVSVSGYLLVTGLLQLLIGPLSDRYGRRPVLIGSFLVFMAATVGALLAPTIEVFLACRMAQAAVASGIALSRAIVRDIAPPEKTASMIGYVTMGMALVPMVSPMLGGILEGVGGWRWSFGALLPMGLAVFALMWMDLGETNRNKSASLTAQIRAYPDLLASRRFWGYALVSAFASGAFFAFLGGAPYVATMVLGLSPEAMGAWFGAIAAGYILGNYIAARWSERWGIGAMMTLGAGAAVIATLTCSVLFWSGGGHPLVLFGPCFFVGMGNGMTLPNANAGMLNARPKLAGSASGLGGAVMIGGGSGMSALAGFLLGEGSGGLPLALVMLASSVLALGVARWVWMVEREVAAEAA